MRGKREEPGPGRDSPTYIFSTLLFQRKARTSRFPSM